MTPGSDGALQLSMYDAALNPSGEHGPRTVVPDGSRTEIDSVPSATQERVTDLDVLSCTPVASWNDRALVATERSRSAAVHDPILALGVADGRTVGARVTTGPEPLTAASESPTKGVPSLVEKVVALGVAVVGQLLEVSGPPVTRSEVGWEPGGDKDPGDGQSPARAVGETVLGATVLG